MDILPSALSNAFQCDVTLYQYRGNVILVDKFKPGRVESIQNIDLFYRNEHYELVVPLAHTDEQYSSEVDDEDTHPEFDSIYRSKTFARGAYQKQCRKSAGETTSYLHEDKHLPILSEKIETLSIERVYNILIGEKDNDNICEKVPHGIETSASFLIDISKLNCLDNLKSNDGEAMSHHGQALRQISLDENGEIVVRRKLTEDDHEDGCFYLYEYVSKTKCKKYCRRIYTLYSDMEKTDLHRYALVQFQIDINYKYTATPRGN